MSIRAIVVCLFGSIASLVLSYFIFREISDAGIIINCILGTIFSLLGTFLIIMMFISILNSKLKQEELKKYVIPLDQLKKFYELYDKWRASHTEIAYTSMLEFGEFVAEIHPYIKESHNKWFIIIENIFSVYLIEDNGHLEDYNISSSRYDSID